MSARTPTWDTPNMTPTASVVGSFSVPPGAIMSPGYPEGNRVVDANNESGRIIRQYSTTAASYQRPQKATKSNYITQPTLTEQNRLRNSSQTYLGGGPSGSTGVAGSYSHAPTGATRTPSTYPANYQAGTLGESVTNQGRSAYPSATQPVSTMYQGSTYPNAINQGSTTYPGGYSGVYQGNNSAGANYPNNSNYNPGTYQGNNSYHPGGKTNLGTYQGGNTETYHGGAYQGGNTGANTGAYQGGNTGANTGAYQGGNTGANTGSYLSGNTGANTGAYLSGNTEVNAGGYQGGNTGAYQGGNTGVYQGGNTGVYQGGNTGVYQGGNTGAYQGAGAYSGTAHQGGPSANYTTPQGSSYTRQPMGQVYNEPWIQVNDYYKCPNSWEMSVGQAQQCPIAYDPMQVKTFRSHGDANTDVVKEGRTAVIQSRGEDRGRRQTDNNKWDHPYYGDHSDRPDRTRGEKWDRTRDDKWDRTRRDNGKSDRPDRRPQGGRRPRSDGPSQLSDRKNRGKDRSRRHCSDSTYNTSNESYDSSRHRVDDYYRCDRSLSSSVCEEYGLTREIHIHHFHCPFKTHRHTTVKNRDDGDTRSLCSERTVNLINASSPRKKFVKPDYRAYREGHPIDNRRRRR